jgi:F420H(2)-dependent quinone reductase
MTRPPSQPAGSGRHRDRELRPQVSPRGDGVTRPSPALRPVPARAGVAVRPQRPAVVPYALAGLAPLVGRAPMVLRMLSAAHAGMLRRTGGRVLGNWFGARVLVLETVGRRSGRLRSTPLVYLPDREDLVVVAANGGADRQPGWWLNLRSAGHAVALIEGERLHVRPREAVGAERDRLWSRFALHAPIATYQRRTSRTLPVVVLAPVTTFVRPRRAGAHQSEPTRRGGLECPTS